MEEDGERGGVGCENNYFRGSAVEGFGCLRLLAGLRWGWKKR